jgi:hypothetical protein
MYQDELITRVVIHRKQMHDDVTTRKVAGFLVFFGLFVLITKSVVVFLLPLIFIAGLLYTDYDNAQEAVKMMKSTFGVPTEK